MNKKCLITGGAGLIGLTTAKLLLKQGFDVHIFDLREQIANVKNEIPKKIKIHRGSILDYKTLKFAMQKAYAPLTYTFLQETLKNILPETEVKKIIEYIKQNRNIGQRITSDIV